MEQNLQAFLIFSIVAAATWRIAIAILKRRRRKFLACLHPIKDAHTLTTHTLYVEFACLRRMSLEVGLLRTFAIPAISRLLHKSREMLHRPSKRYDDTDILVQELMHHHVDSERGSVALRRLNFLHGQYRIENQEYIYVLAVFVLLPQDWAMRYGHRSFTEAESCAYYTVWRDVGTRMGIRDIPGSLEALRSFMEEYEAKNMVYSESNKAVAEANMEMFLGSLPTLLRPVAVRVAWSLMDERLLKALGFAKQPYWLECFSHGLLRLTMGTIVGWLPPRPLSWAKLRIPVGVGCCGAFDPEAFCKLAFHVYKPFTYEKGYRLKDLGSIKPGELGSAFPGPLLCPFPECNQKMWPPTLK